MQHDPPEGAELFDYEGVPVSRHDPGPDADLVTLVWTPIPRLASPKTEWHAVTRGAPIDRADFDRLRRSFAR
jgi:hypothetical protein